MNDSIRPQCRERHQPRCISVKVEVVISVVLNDQQVVLISYIEELCSSVSGEGNARRVLEIWNRVYTLHAPAFRAGALDLRLKVLNDDSTVILLNADEISLRIMQRDDPTDITRELYQRDVTRIEHYSRYKIEALL